MKLKNFSRTYLPTMLLLTCIITLFPFLYIFTQAWDELPYGIVLGVLSLQLFFSVFCTVATKKKLLVRIILSIVLTGTALGLLMFIPIYYFNNIIFIGAYYAATFAVLPIVLIFAINAARALLRQGSGRYRLLRAAGLVLCMALAVLPFMKYSDIQKNKDAVGVYCHNANQVLCAENLLLDCGEQAVQLIDSNNTPYAGNNRVYANLIVGNRGISVGDESSISDYNVFASPLDKDAMQHNFKDTLSFYSLEAWQKMGFDTDSVCLPVSVSLDPRTLLLTVNADGALLPEMPVVKEFLPGVIGSNGLDYDFFAAERKDGAFGVGAFITLPDDGTAISVDPRCGK